MEKVLLISTHHALRTHGGTGVTALERHLRKWMEKAIIDFGLIKSGDGVVAAVSGGKDSLALLRLLQGPFVHAPRDFRLVAVHIDGGIPGSDPDALAAHFESLGVEYEIVRARNIYEAAHAPGSRKSPCYVCSRMRRKALMETADRLGCKKVALAHHRDDVAETLLMNMFFNREISAPLPDQPLFDGSFHLVRPLYYIRERLLTKFVAQAQLPVMSAKCPDEDVSRRRFVKNLLAHMEKEEPYAHSNLFRSMFRVFPEYLPAPVKKLELPRDH